MLAFKELSFSSSDFFMSVVLNAHIITCVTVYIVLQQLQIHCTAFMYMFILMYSI